MKIGTKERLLTITTLAVIGAVALMIWWTSGAVEAANQQRQQAGEIARMLSQLRLLTVEYRLYHNERSKVQWYEVSDRVDRLIASAQASIPAQHQILTQVRERRATDRRLFEELAPIGAGLRADTPLNQSTRRYETLLVSRMLAEQQDNIDDVFRLTNLASDRINEAQGRALAIVLSGLALVAMIKTGVSWLIRRDVLTPIARLQHAAQDVAAGDWNTDFGPRGSDEVSELANNIDTMTRSLRGSFLQLEQRNQELAMLNKELEAFSYSVSHDLRAPLRSMDGFAMVLIEDYSDKLDDDGKDALMRIRAASQRMGNLIDDLLRLSQVTRAGLSMTRVDLSAMAREIAADIDRRPSGRSAEWVIESGLCVHADLTLIRIAMQNLLENAWKFTGRTQKPVIRVGAIKRDGRTVYFVADNGAGFDMAHASKLFGAFQRLHHVGDFPGTGIGLAISKRIVHRHDGEIWAEAKPDEGATFFFRVKESGDGSPQDNPAD